jgi:hypothetical protein
MASAIDTAVDAFRATLVERGALAGTATADAAEVGHRAALLAQSATAWQDHLGPVESSHFLLGLRVGSACRTFVLPVGLTGRSRSRVVGTAS